MNNTLVMLLLLILQGCVLGPTRQQPSSPPLPQAVTNPPFALDDESLTKSFQDGLDESMADLKRSIEKAFSSSRPSAPVKRGPTASER